MRITFLFFVFSLFSCHHVVMANQSFPIDSIIPMESLYQVRSIHGKGEPDKSQVLEVNNLVVFSSDFKTLRIYTHSIEKYSFELGEQYWEHGYGLGKYWVAEGRMDSGQAVKVIALQREGELQWLRLDFLGKDYSVTYVGHIKRYIKSIVADITLEFWAPPPHLLSSEHSSSGLSFVPPK
jgi:hypothetical protein